MEWAPVLTADVSGGYSRFSGEKLDGPNGSILFVPGMRFGGDFSLLPILTVDYQKARDVQELAGGGFLTVAQHSRGASLRAIQAAGPLKLKLYGAYKQNLLKETKDEPWGKGLFDYDKTATGVEVEGKGRGKLESWRAGLDYYVTKFPNFQSLASRQAGAEIDAGRDVLDFRAMDLPLAADLVVGRERLELRALNSFRRFPDQKRIKEGPSFSGLRRDYYLDLAAGVTRVLQPVSLKGKLESSAGFDAGRVTLHSDQNSFDVAAAAFRPNFYSYTETSAGPRWRFRWREWMTGGVSYLYAFRAYAGRPAQNADGSDRGGAIRTRTQTFRLSLGFPLSQGFAIQLQGASQHADSNTARETTYRYNYSSSNYFLGVTYEL